MSDNLPIRRPQGDVARPGGLTPGRPRPGDVPRPVPPPGVPAEGADIVASALNIGEIKAEKVTIVVNHYHAQVTQHTEVNRVEQTRVDRRSERLDYRPSYTPIHAPTYAPTYVPGYAAISDAPRGRGGSESLRILAVAFLGFTAFLFVVAASYRWLMTPVAVPTTTVVVPVMEGADRPIPRSYLETLEAQGR